MSILHCQPSSSWGAGCWLAAAGAGLEPDSVSNENRQPRLACFTIKLQFWHQQISIFKYLEKVTTSAFSLLKAPTGIFTFYESTKTLLLPSIWFQIWRATDIMIQLTILGVATGQGELRVERILRLLNGVNWLSRLDGGDLGARQPQTQSKT